MKNVNTPYRMKTIKSLISIRVTLMLLMIWGISGIVKAQSESLPSRFELVSTTPSLEASSASIETIDNLNDCILKPKEYVNSIFKY